MKIKIIFFLFLCCIPLHAKKYVKSVVNLNLRTSPSLSSPVRVTIPQGLMAEVLDEKYINGEMWYKVKVYCGNERKEFFGFAKKKYFLLCGNEKKKYIIINIFVIGGIIGGIFLCAYLFAISFSQGKVQNSSIDANKETVVSVLANTKEKKVDTSMNEMTIKEEKDSKVYEKVIDDFEKDNTSNLLVALIKERFSNDKE